MILIGLLIYTLLIGKRKCTSREDKEFIIATFYCRNLRTLSRLYTVYVCTIQY